MGYLSAVLVVILNGIKGIAGKYVSQVTHTLRNNVFAQTLRGLISLILSFLLLLFTSSVGLLNVDSISLLIFLLAGVSLVVQNIWWIVLIKQNIFSLCDAFAILSCLAPTLIFHFTRNEKIGILQIIAYPILLIGTILMVQHSSEVKQKFSFKIFINYFIMTLSFIGYDVASKLYFYHCKDIGIELNSFVYNFYTFAISAGLFIVILAVLMLFTRKQSIVKEYVADKKLYLCLGIMSFFMIGVQIFSVYAALLPSAILFPLMKGTQIVVNTVLSITIFKEKMTPRLFIGLGIILISIALISISEVVNF